MSKDTMDKETKKILAVTIAVVVVVIAAIFVLAR